MTVRTHRARVASLTRHRAPDDPDLSAARGDLLLAHAERLAAEAPPLTDEQRAKLGALLQPLIQGSGDTAA